MKRNKSGDLKVKNGYEIQVKSGVTAEKVLTKEEQAILLEGMHSSTTLVNAAFFHLHRMLGCWVQAQDEAIESLVDKTVSKSQSQHDCDRNPSSLSDGCSVANANSSAFVDTNHSITNTKFSVVDTDRSIVGTNLSVLDHSVVGAD